MSQKLPSIGAVTTSTNSLSRGYLSFLACIDSWCKWVDQVIIVDGGTTDETYETLKQWTHSLNWKIHKTKTSHWGRRGLWHAGQWTINTNEGLNAIETDWVFVLNSDYVLDTKSVQGIRKLLSINGDASYVTFTRSKLTNSGGVYTAYPGVALNMRKLKKNGMLFGFGEDHSANKLSDAPIYFQQKTRFIDPENKEIKNLYRGDHIKPSFALGLNSVVYGHYFFSYYQVLEKLSDFWEIYNIRYSKKVARSQRSFVFQFGFSPDGTILSKDKELMKPHPEEIKRVIDHYYYPEMVGHGNKMKNNTVQFGIKALQKVKNQLFKFTGFKSIQESQQWVDLLDNKVPPLDLQCFYSLQDRYLKLNSSHS